MNKRLTSNPPAAALLSLLSHSSSFTPKNLSVTLYQYLSTPCYPAGLLRFSPFPQNSATKTHLFSSLPQTYPSSSLYITVTLCYPLTPASSSKKRWTLLSLFLSNPSGISLSTQSNQTKAPLLSWFSANLLKISLQPQPPDHHYPAAASEKHPTSGQPTPLRKSPLTENIRSS